MRFEPAPATETTFGGGTLTIFETQSELAVSPGAVVRVGVRVSSAWWIESSFALDAARLVTHVTQDRDVAPTTVRESITQYVVEVGAAVRIRRRRAGRPTPFLAGGGGYIRQLHDGQTFAEGSWSSYAGGGLHYEFAGTGARPGTVRAGLRVDGRGMLVHRDIALDDRFHVAPIVEATLFVRF